MMCQTIARVTAVVLLLLGALLGPGSLLSPSQVEAQVISDYTAFPPFITNVTTPNILIIMDNSGSMEGPACDPSGCGVLPDGTTSTSTMPVGTSTDTSGTMMTNTSATTTTGTTATTTTGTMGSTKTEKKSTKKH